MIIRLVSLGRPPGRRARDPSARSRRCASTPRPGSTPAGCATRRRWRRRRLGGGLGGGGMRIPLPGGTKAGGGIGVLLIIVVFLVLTQCMRRHRPDRRAPGHRRDGSARAGSPATRPLRRAARRARTPTTTPTCGAGGGRELPVRLLVATPCPQQAPHAQFQPETAIQTFTGGTAPAAARRRRPMGPFYCPVDQTIYLDTTFFERRPPAAAQRPVGRVRRALRPRPRVRPPHPEPARHDGPGEDPAGTQQRLRPPRAPGRLLRRHVGQERHQHRGPPRASR